MYVRLGVNSVRVNVSMHPLGAGLSLVGREDTAHKKWRVRAQYSQQCHRRGCKRAWGLETPCTQTQLVGVCVVKTRLASGSGRHAGRTPYTKAMLMTAKE